MFIASSKDDSAGLVADEALSDESGTKVPRSGRSALLQNGIGGQDLRDQGVTGGSGFELIHFGEDRLSFCGFAVSSAFLLLLRVRRH